MSPSIPTVPAPTQFPTPPWATDDMATRYPDLHTLEEAPLCRDQAVSHTASEVGLIGS